MHWFDLLQTTRIVVGLFATVHTIRANTRERKIDNLFAITSAHRDLWTQFYQRKELQRVTSMFVDLESQPITIAERRFVIDLILHLRASYRARRFGLEFNQNMLAADIRQFFNRPIPRAVWEMVRQYQERDFVQFLEANIGTVS